MRPSHLDTIDAQAWPGIAQVPSGLLIDVRARLAEAAFARACSNAGLSLDPEGGADLIVEREELFSRLAASGWLGVAEGYLAGEWRTDSLTDVLAAFLRTGYRPRGISRVPAAVGSGGEIPAELVHLSSGDGMSDFSGVFASGVPTTVRTSVPSHSPDGPDTHFIDLTTFTPPLGAERGDLGDAQRRTAEMLLDAALVTPGTHLMEFPSSGGAVAMGAAKRRATVDTLTADAAQAAAVRERLTFAGVEDNVHTDVIAQPVPGPRDWLGRYDSIISVDKLAVLEPRERIELLRSFDRILDHGGRIALQTPVATEAMTPAARAALGALRAYIWPGLDYPTVVDVQTLVDRETGLRIVGQTHLAEHAQQTLAMQRSLFEGHSREAAADGFDSVYRRLWRYQFALREAMFRLGMLDVVQFTLTHRHRRGRR